MLNPRFALLPGSFDPPTLGHLDLARRAARIFDEIWVVAFVNAEKHGFFSAKEKRELLLAAFGEIPNAHVDVSDALLADYAAKNRIGVLVKGARCATDFDYEMSLSLINRSLDEQLDTILLPTRAEYLHISSTMVREMIRYGRDYQSLVPPSAARLIAELVKKDGK